MTIEELLYYKDYENYCYKNETRNIKKNMNEKEVKELLKEGKYYSKFAPKKLKMQYILSYVVFVNMFKDKEKILNTLYDTPVMYKKRTTAGELTGDDNVSFQKGFTRIFEDGSKIIYLGDIYNGKKISEVELLNNFLHEFRHVLTSNMFDIGLRKDNNYISIEEVYNTYFTEILINNLISLNYYDINDYKIKYYLKKIKQEYYYHSPAYREEMLITNPVILNKELSEEINRLSFKCENEKARNIFPEFIQYATSLDEISNILNTRIGVNEIEKILAFKQKTLQLEKMIK